MSVARLNASHGSPDDRRALVEAVKAVRAEQRDPLATMLDLPGPEIRTAAAEAEAVLEEGTTVAFDQGETIDEDRVGLSTSLDGVTEGDRLLLDDGRVETTVVDVGARVGARVDSGGPISGRTGVNVPGVDLGLPTITDADEAELDVAAEAGVDFVAASFVRSAADVLEINAALEDRGADVPIIAKIERADAVENADEILEVADGLMVARGDLGVECPLEDVPIVQKQLIRKSRLAGVPVITATEMLDSMVEQRRPTRAETSDVANAVLDGTDAVMLSGETAIGEHPVRVVETMARIVGDVEASDEYAEVLEQRVPPAGDTRPDALSRSARYLARDTDAEAIVAASESGTVLLEESGSNDEMRYFAQGHNVDNGAILRGSASRCSLACSFEQVSQKGIVADGAAVTLHGPIVRGSDGVALLARSDCVVHGGVLAGNAVNSSYAVIADGRTVIHGTKINSNTHELKADGADVRLRDTIHVQGRRVVNAVNGAHVTLSDPPFIASNANDTIRAGGSSTVNCALTVDQVTDANFQLNGSGSETIQIRVTDNVADGTVRGNIPNSSGTVIIYRDDQQALEFGQGGSWERTDTTTV